MRHLLCLTFCWILTPCLAQENSPGLVPAATTEPELLQDDTGAAAANELFDGPATPDQPQAATDQGKRRARGGRGTSALGAGTPAVPNPFDLPNAGMMMGGYGEMEGESMDSGEDMMSDMGMGGMGMEMGMGMGGMEDYGGGEGGYGEMYGAGGSAMSSADQRFQAGLQRAIAAIRMSESEENRKTLLNFVRQAFEERYDESIQSRQKQLSQIKQRVAKLEVELKRREAAKSRVVEVQLQSVQLAAEGLLELDGQ